MKNELIGTWKLESAEDFLDGQWVNAFGDSPKGYFSFGSDGQISVQFMKSPLDPNDRDETRASYLAYFGSYAVDENANTFTSTVEGSVDIRLVGSQQIRSFRIVAGKLIVGDLVTYRRSFVKV